MPLYINEVLAHIEKALGWDGADHVPWRTQKVKLQDIEAEIARLRTVETEAIAFRDRIEVDERLAAEQFLPEVSADLTFS
jgi:hypothetical protein